eukprot:GHRR01027854.1.p2 GENE.GHRR01027854.1~~GHRR01027854.1.p2  ORF type:complete len:123 (-),score=31.10 GHRR01027854.1:657-1025(-)
MSSRKLFGMALAVTGMIAYGYFVSRENSPSKSTSSKMLGAIAKNGIVAATGRGRGDIDMLELGKGTKIDGETFNEVDGVMQWNENDGRDAAAQVPLLRNVSRDTNWAGDSVMVVSVGRDGQQ